MFHAPFGTQTGRAAARERLAPLLSDLRLTDARARERRAGAAPEAWMAVDDYGHLTVR